MGNKQTAEAMRAQAVDDAMKRGYVLTRYFYNYLLTFEKDPAGLRAAYGDMLDAIDLKQQEKVANEIEFADVASPELVQLSRLEDRRMLSTAEKRLEAGDPKGAEELAHQALDRKIGDQGRALFILAEVAVADKNRDGALENFQKAIQATKDPKVVGWSHVYLGRILDMKEDRDAAMNEYRAALTVGADLPEIKAAAERDCSRPTNPRSSRNKNCESCRAIAANMVCSISHDRGHCDKMHGCKIWHGVSTRKVWRLGERMKRAAIVVAVLGMCAWSFAQNVNLRHRVLRPGRPVRPRRLQGHRQANGRRKQKPNPNFRRTKTRSR